MAENPYTGVRLATTSTTGWNDWFQGELWLFQSGIVRVPIGWLKTFSCVGYIAELRNPKSRTFSSEEFNRLISRRRNMWIPREGIKSAALSYSPFMAYDLRIQMFDGRSFQLLTLPRSFVYLELQSALQEWLRYAFVSNPPKRLR